MCYSRSNVQLQKEVMVVFLKFGFISSWTWEITYVIRSGTVTAAICYSPLQVH